MQRVDLDAEINDRCNDLPEELLESKSEMLRKKPNSATGVLGREGGAGMLRSQIQNNYVNLTLSPGLMTQNNLN